MLKTISFYESNIRFDCFRILIVPQVIELLCLICLFCILISEKVASDEKFLEQIAAQQLSNGAFRLNEELQVKLSTKVELEAKFEGIREEIWTTLLVLTFIDKTKPKLRRF